MQVPFVFADTITGISDDGRQEIALDEDEYDGDENGSDLGVVPSGEERLQGDVDSKGEVTDTGSSNAVTAGNAMASSIISKSVALIYNP